MSEALDRLADQLLAAYGGAVYDVTVCVREGDLDALRDVRDASTAAYVSLEAELDKRGRTDVPAAPVDTTKRGS